MRCGLVRVASGGNHRAELDFPPWRANPTEINELSHPWGCRQSLLTQKTTSFTVSAADRVQAEPRLPPGPDFLNPKQPQEAVAVRSCWWRGSGCQHPTPTAAKRETDNCGGGNGASATSSGSLHTARRV